MLGIFQKRRNNLLICNFIHQSWQQHIQGLMNEKRVKKNNNANCKRNLQHRLLKIHILHIQLSQVRYSSQNYFNLLVINELGNLELKNEKISSTRLVLFVLNNFIEKRLTAKSRERTSLLFRLHASVPYNKTGNHLLDARCSNTSLEANLPTLKKWHSANYATLTVRLVSVNVRPYYYVSKTNYFCYFINKTRSKK